MRACHPFADDEFDIDKERAGEDADLVPEEKPPEWDIDMSVQAAPFNVMLTCYTLFERDRCSLAGAGRCAACLQQGTTLSRIATSRRHKVSLQPSSGGRACMPPGPHASAPLPCLPPPCSPEQRLDRGFLEKWRWSHLIMDEAHALKNRNASRTTRLRRIANASRRRIMMTGAGGRVRECLEGGRMPRELSGMTFQRSTMSKLPAAPHSTLFAPLSHCTTGTPLQNGEVAPPAGMSSHLRCLLTAADVHMLRAASPPCLHCQRLACIHAYLLAGFPHASRGRQLACSSGVQASALHLHQCALRPADLAELQNLLHFLLPSVFAAQGFEDLAEMLQVRARPVGRGQCHALAVAGHDDVLTLSDQQAAHPPAEPAHAPPCSLAPPSPGRR